MKLKLLLLAILVLCATTAEAAVVGYTACSYFEGASCTTCTTTAHTVGASDNYLVVFVGQDNDVDATNITGASWDSTGTPQAMTAVSDNAGTGVVAGKAFTLVNPTVGNKTLSVSATNGTRCCYIIICSFTGVDTGGTPLGTIVENEQGGGSNTTSSLAFSLGAGGLAVDFLISQGPFTSFAHGADQTSRSATTDGCNSNCQSQVSTATVSPLDYTWTASSNAFWHVVLPINAAADATPLRRRTF